MRHQQRNKINDLLLSLHRHRIIVLCTFIYIKNRLTIGKFCLFYSKREYFFFSFLLLLSLRVYEWNDARWRAVAQTYRVLIRCWDNIICLCDMKCLLIQCWCENECNGGHGQRLCADEAWNFAQAECHNKWKWLQTKQMMGCKSFGDCNGDGYFAAIIDDRNYICWIVCHLAWMLLNFGRNASLSLFTFSICARALW